MKDTFITKINIEKVRHLENVDIVLSENSRKHLILTGRNGSGKTSLLEALKDDVIHRQGSIEWKRPAGERNRQLRIKKLPRMTVEYSQKIKNFRDFIFVSISARRKEFIMPKSIETMEMGGNTAITRDASKHFLHYIINLDYQLYGAKADKNKQLESNLQKWFDNFESALRDMYECPDLELKRDAKNLSFRIKIPGREPFALHEMSDGFASFFEIAVELLMRFESGEGIVDYNRSAVVMIDEIEAHLHVALQKKILPFLTKMFPNVQFIVSTHSPFVITSSADAVVYDLENKIQLENPHIYSYEAILEGYLDVGQYSEDMKKTFKRYKELYSKSNPSESENIELQELVSKLSMVPPASKELYLAFRTLEDKRKNGQN